ncbi:MAG: hypothetical protein Q8910_00765 [Bacteroidota bacterium]|nr:hypothetical protein [Bacteroidota bacterium]
MEDTKSKWYPEVTNYTSEDGTKKSIQQREEEAKRKAQEGTLQKRMDYDLLK